MEFPSKDEMAQEALQEKSSFKVALEVEMLEYLNTGILLLIFGYLIKLSGRISRIEGYLNLKNNPKRDNGD